MKKCFTLTQSYILRRDGKNEDLRGNNGDLRFRGLFFDKMYLFQQNFST